MARLTALAAHSVDGAQAAKLLCSQAVLCHKGAAAAGLAKASNTHTGQQPSVQHSCMAMQQADHCADGLVPDTLDFSLQAGDGPPELVQ